VQSVTNRLELDHLVYAVPDLFEAIRVFEKKIGLQPVPGGRHEGLGTHNAILPLDGGQYLELMAADPDGPAPPQARPFGLDSLVEARLVTWAVRSHAIEVDVEAARQNGFDPGVVLNMTRKTTDGELLEWKLSLKTTPFGDGLVPFVIDWGTSPHPAVSGDSASRCALSDFAGRHPNPKSISQALEALGADLPVKMHPRAHLTARLTGPQGTIELS
jgi:hypothetical protein